jgi:DNA-binding NtrC family response regulator
MTTTPLPSASAGTVLVVDDDVDAAELVADSLRARGLRAIAEANPHEALSDAMKDDLDVVVTDLQMRSLDGLELCQRIAKARPDLPVVVMTGHASVDAAVGALRAGAFDFIVKPVDAELLALTVGRAVQHHRLASEVHRLRTVVAGSERAGRLLGDSPAMKRVYDVIRRIAPTEATVLVTGESGTGKELVARADPRAQRALGGAVHRDQLRRGAREPARERALRSRQAAPSPTPRPRGAASSSRRRAARSSSTRSARCRSRCR